MEGVAAERRGRGALVSRCRAGGPPARETQESDPRLPTPLLPRLFYLIFMSACFRSFSFLPVLFSTHCMWCVVCVPWMIYLCGVCARCLGYGRFTA